MWRGEKSFSPRYPPTFPAGLGLGEQTPTLGAGLPVGVGNSSSHSLELFAKSHEWDLGMGTCCSYLFLLDEFCSSLGSSAHSVGAAFGVGVGWGM